MKRLLILIFLGITSLATAQPASQQDEVKSVNGIMAALYDVLSGDPGTPRNWDRFRNLFIPEARLIPTVKSKEGSLGYRVISPEEYIELFSTRITGGFFERELHAVTESYGAIVHIFSTYESYRSESDEKPFARGINSIQLLNDGNRWWIINIYWVGESQSNPIPEAYLPKR